MFSSPFIFDHNNALEEFTRIDVSIIISVTSFNHKIIVFIFNVIFWVNISVVVGIIVNDKIIEGCINVIAGPSTSTINTSEWLITIDISVCSWTIFSSPFIFDHNNTVMNFTFIKLIITIEITIHVDFS